MITWECGAALRDLLSEATTEVIIAAPFIRADAFQALLDVVSNDVAVTCVTRWRLEDFLHGVADLSPWYKLQGRATPDRLLTRRDLHAKYFRADASRLIGSANVTRAALGWSTDPNFEVLVSGPTDDSEMVAFEAMLIDGATEVTADLIEQLELDLAALPMPPMEELVDRPGEPGVRELAPWLPVSRQPENLWIAYGGDGDQLTSRAAADAASDLVHLALPPGLDISAFVAATRVTLRAEPIVRCVDEFALAPRRFGEMRELLAQQYSGLGLDAGTSWQTLMRWLLAFFPERYSVGVPGSYSEVFSVRPL